MTELAFYAATRSALLFLLVIWGLLALHALARQEARGRPAFAQAMILLYGAAPLLFWATGTHRPIGDYGKLAALTAHQRAMGRVSVIMMIALLICFAVIQLPCTRAPGNPLGRRLLLAYLGFAAGPLLAIVFGTDSGFRLTLLFAPATMTVVYLSMRRGDPDWWTTIARRLLLVYVWASLAAAIITPEWAFDASSRATLLMGATTRLVGVTAAPNTLGPIAATVLIIVLTTSRGRWRWTNAIAAGVVLVLTDSRMAMVGTVVGLIIVFIHHRQCGRGLRTALVASVVAVPLLLVALSTSPLTTLASATDGSLSAQQVSTANGRVEVWRTTLTEWRRNPVFGYGPDLWSPEYRSQHGQQFSWAGQAHNQWVQTLGDSGLVGLTGLLFYVVVLIRTAAVTSRRSGGLTGALVALLLLRMTSESALRSPGLDAVTLLHVVTFAILVVFSMAPAKDRLPKSTDVIHAPSKSAESIPA